MAWRVRDARPLCRRGCATNADGGCDVKDRGVPMRCCAGDGGWPSGTALQEEVPNHRKLLRSTAVVVSVAEKAHVSEPLGKRRKRIDVIETGVQSLPRDEPGG